jgi:hypothetical protein
MAKLGYWEAEKGGKVGEDTVCIGFALVCLPNRICRS